MLSEAKAAATVGVKDMAKAKEFYEGVLGLEPMPGRPDDMPDEAGVMYSCGGGTSVFVYQTSYAGTNEATAVTWSVDDVEAEMNELQAKGVKFEDYDLPGLKTKDGLATWGNTKAAWFKDPDGNILNIGQM